MALAQTDNLASTISTLDTPNALLSAQLTGLLQSGDPMSVDNMLQMQSAVNSLTVDSQLRSSIIKAYGDVLKSILQKMN
jgi:hypothetical protein